MTEDSPLAQFLRARRSSVQPADVGLPAGGRRRVAGLRREEVAVLAGISTDYYLRLEQGREDHPSDHVLDAIGRALLLDDAALMYMRNIMQHKAISRIGEQPEKPHPAIGTLLDGWPLTAAHVVDPGLTVVRANVLAAALSPHFGVGVNTVRQLFLDTVSQDLYYNWKRLTAWAVRLVRALYGQGPDPRLIELVDELIQRSPWFRQLWDRHEVKHESAGVMRINHPQVGPIQLNYQQMILPATGHVLVAYWAESGSVSEARMSRLDTG